MHANRPWGQDGPEERPRDFVDAIVDRLRDPSRDQRGDADLLELGLDIIRRRQGIDSGRRGA